MLSESSIVLGTPQLHSLPPLEQEYNVSFRAFILSPSPQRSVRQQLLREVSPFFRCEMPRSRLDRADEDLTGLALSMFGKMTLLIPRHPPGGEQRAGLGLPSPAYIFGRVIAAPANSSCSLAELKASVFFQAWKLPERGDLASLYGTEPS